MRYRKWVRKGDTLTPKLTPEIINAAILGFEQQKRQIDTNKGGKNLAARKPLQSAEQAR